MSQNTKEMHMFNIGDMVTVTGKVNYVVSQVDGDNVTAESMNTGNARTFQASKLKLVASAETEPMNVPQSAEEVPAVSEDVEEFDPRKDRRQSAYGLAILAAVMRKGANNPKQFAHNSNPLKSVGGKRHKVRARVRAQRTQTCIGNAQYNALYKAYSVKAA